MFSSYTKGLFSILTIQAIDSFSLIEIEPNETLLQKLAKKQKQFTHLTIGLDGVPAKILFMQKTIIVEVEQKYAFKTNQLVSISLPSCNKRKYLLEQNPIGEALLIKNEKTEGDSHILALEFRTSKNCLPVFERRWLGLNGCGFTIQNFSVHQEEIKFTVHADSNPQAKTFFNQNLPINHTVRLTRAYFFPATQIPTSELKFGTVYQATFGTLWVGTWKDKQVMIKKFHDIPENSYKQFLLDAETRENLFHPNILTYFGMCNTHIIMEYHSLGSLDNLFYKLPKDALPWQPYRWNMAYQIALGLQYLHQQEIVHSNLRASNIILTKELLPKISDFDSYHLKSINSITCSVRWSAPELLQPHALPTKASNVYAYCLILWHIATTEIPFRNALSSFIIVTWLMQNVKEIIPENIPDGWKKIIEQGWQVPDKRPNMDEIVTSFKNIMPSVTEKTLPLDIYYYQQGLQFWKNFEYDKAQAQFKIAANFHYPPALVKCAFLKERSISSINQYGDWFKKQLDTSDPDLQFDLGYCFEMQILTTSENIENIIEKYIHSQTPEQLVKEITQQFSRENIKNDCLNKAIEFYKKSAQQNYPQAQLFLANLLIAKKQYNEAILWLSKLAELKINVHPVFYLLGTCYSKLNQFNLAASNFEKEIESSNHAESKCELGFIFKHGKGGEKNPKKAFDLFLSAAQQNNAQAQFQTSLCYEYGDSCEQNSFKAYFWLRKAAENGHERAGKKIAAKSDFLKLFQETHSPESNNNSNNSKTDKTEIEFKANKPS